jgi:two-component system, OmpR family, KDP operon response regulator KdpE
VGTTANSHHWLCESCPEIYTFERHVNSKRAECEAEMKPTILVVEDDLDTLKGLAIRLEANGLVVLQANTAVSALVLARAGHPDVIVLDLGLPDLSGYSILAQLKEFPATAYIPVIVLTARDPHGNQARSYKTGAFEFFQKPVNHQWLFGFHKKGAGKGYAECHQPSVQERCLTVPLR